MVTKTAAILVGISAIGICLAIAILAYEGRLPSLSRRRSESQGRDGLICNVRVTLMSLESGGDGETFECTPVKNDTLRDLSYPIELPPALLAENRKALQSGQLYIRIPGGYINEKYIEGVGKVGTDVFIPNDAEIEVLNPQDESLLKKHNQTKRRRNLGAEGVHTVMVFRVTTDDATPEVGATEIENRIFSMSEFSTFHQFDLCSSGEISFEPVDSRTLVNELYLPGAVSNYTERSILTAAMTVATNVHGSNLWNELDHAIFCMPAGTAGKPYIAYSGVGSFFSVFHNDRCAYPTTVMHELSHNLGLGHAYENGVEYADETSIMGYSSNSKTGPRKCYNGQNFWHLGWFSDRTIVVDPFQGTQLVELAAFVDYNTSYSNQAVLVSIFDIYLVYNRAKGCNVGVSEYPNLVTITQDLNDINSAMLGIVGPSKKFFAIPNFRGSNRTLHIETCKTFISTIPPDYTLLSIGLDGSMCPTTLAPIPSPTLYPTAMPTKGKTLSSTHSPSSEPTMKLPIITNAPQLSSKQPPGKEPKATIATESLRKQNVYNTGNEHPKITTTPSSPPSQPHGANSINESNHPLKLKGETLAMIFCAAALTLFTSCCMFAVFRWNQRRQDEQKRNLQILEKRSSSQLKLYMQDPV